MIFNRITYAEGGYEPGAPGSNVAATEWACSCGAGGQGLHPAACPACGAVADEPTTDSTAPEATK